MDTFCIIEKNNLKKKEEKTKIFFVEKYQPIEKDDFIIQEQLDYVQINSQLSDNVEFVIINSYGIEIDSGKFNKSVKINKNIFISGIYFIKLKTPYHEEILKLGLNQ